VKKNIVLLFCFLFNALAAQNPSYQHLNDETDLPSNEVFSIIQDHKGFIWIGCDAGLYRYNGIRFQKYYTVSQKSTALTGLALSKDSILYCYNFSNQIFYVKDDSLQEIESWEGKRKQGFPNIAVDKENKLWVTAENQLYSFDVRTNLWSKKGSNDTAKVVNLVVVDSKGDIWSGQNFSIKGTNGDIYTIRFEAGASSNIADYIIAADEQDIWLVSIAGGNIYQLQNESFNPYRSPKLHEALRHRKITSVKSFNDKLYITTYSGILIYDKEKDKIEIWYPNEVFSSCLLDRENNLWLTTLGNGIYFIREKEFCIWNKQESKLPEDRITCVESIGNTLFFSMQNGFIGRLDLEQNKVSLFSNQTRADIRALFIDETSDKLYFNTNNTLYWLNQKKISILSDQIGPVKKIIKTRENYIVCTSFGTFSYADLRNINTCRSLSVLWSRDAAFIEQEQTLLVATNNGLLKWNKSLTTFSFDTTFLENTQVVSLFLESQNEELFVLTFKGDVYSYSYKKCRKICQVPSAARSYILAKYSNKIYIGTSAGLWIYDTETQKWENISKNTGLASNDIKAIRMSGDKLWLATAKGLQSIPLGYSNSKPRPIVYLKSVLIDGKKITDRYLNLDYNSTLSIAAEAVNYFSLQGFQFAYRIFGGDTNWRFVNSADEYFMVAGLKSGNFAIELAVVDHLGRFSKNNIFIGGRVIPPFWQRWWFYFIIGLAGVGIAYLFFLLRIKSLQKRQAEKIARIKLESELAISQQTALKAQMNPHFIFNVLNSIKSYIYENDKKAAANYLSKFADLTRGILAMSSQPMVKLSDELKALQLYMDLEALQMESPFHCDIILNDLIDADSVQIPSLIIQPFLENSFKHGLRHKSGEKLLILTIELMQDTNQLRVVIEDNGIGRAKSAEINMASGEKHQSFATDASAQRLNLLNKGKQEIVNVVFEDKTDQRGHALGTTVTLNIQL
jgi:ligand-binding sensor domain-containing protein/two-component sensor histidine kinase